MPDEKVMAVSAKMDELPCVTLGAEVEIDVVEIDDPTPSTVEERVVRLEKENTAFKMMFDSLYKMVKALKDRQNIEQDKKIAEFVEKNKATKKIPIGTVLHGTSRNKSFFLEVATDGFIVGQVKYPSLSAAAEAVSGVRRSGLAFWKFSNDKSVKDMVKE